MTRTKRRSPLGTGHKRFWRSLLVVISVLLVIGLTQCSPVAPPQIMTVQLQRVVSGDLLEVTGLGEQPNQIQSVRLIGLDAPDPGQEPWDKQAQEFLAAQLSDRQVALEYDLQMVDAFGRQLAYVWHNAKLVNEELVATGHALSTPYFPNVLYEERLQRAQEAARLSGVGLWNPVDPLRQSPAEFRQQTTP